MLKGIFRMCGIVGLFLKDKSLHPKLGHMLSEMLETMTDRGPDSAGIAIYGTEKNKILKISLHTSDSNSFVNLKDEIESRWGNNVSIDTKSTSAILDVNEEFFEPVKSLIDTQFPEINTLSFGSTIEIFKGIGLPADVSRSFSINSMSGSHGIGHTRMATESAVTTLGCHPFSTGEDQCLVHNGSLSNHNTVRNQLIRHGMKFETENDSEVAAAYLSYKMDNGSSLSDAMQSALRDLDGFFTFVVGTREGFGVVRDSIACKPAVLAETEKYVAFGSEYRSLVGLPSINLAQVWEPDPGTVYFWEN